MADNEYLAHSARDGRPEQSYRAHVENVHAMAVQNAGSAAKYAVMDGALLNHVVDTASLVHDLGKLHAENQTALHQQDGHAHLPVNHVDAGVVFLRQAGQSFNAQMAVYSHHRGLPDMVAEEYRKHNFFRDNNSDTRKKVNQAVSSLLRKHKELISDDLPIPAETEIQGDPGVFCRMMLSCLADADHTDTARHYGKYPESQDEPALLPERRLERLNAYVDALGKDGGERTQLRQEMYVSSRDAEVGASIVSCDSPVGSGKTTAIMAHLLRQAAERGARRIFVVLPFTNIIKQSVDTYRKALVLPGEDPEKVVAELHHRADFQSVETRALTAQWHAPVIVTTAVAFFETLASNRPSALRRLHELPGSMIFVDEAHAALPVKLLPLAWHWMQTLADEWRCYWVLASGSLVEFWNLDADGWEKEPRKVPPMLPDSLRNRLIRYETLRIQFRYEQDPLSREELIKKVISSPGPRLLIMNTVQSAAVIARDMQTYYGEDGRGKVMHLSTALNAEDRNRTVEAVRKRLSNSDDSDWTLVATSCVEAGVDFSFRTGFREIASLLSLLQAAGRISRSGEYEDAVIWSFVMQDDSLLTRNKRVRISADILNGYFLKKIPVEPSLSTRSMQEELRHAETNFGELLRAEDRGRFSLVEEEFKVIDEDTVLVIADEKLKEQIRFGGVDWRSIQSKAVSVHSYRVKNMRLRPIVDGIYDWDAGYDSFLGVMNGILNFQEAKSGFLNC